MATSIFSSYFRVFFLPSFVLFCFGVIVWKNTKALNMKIDYIQHRTFAEIFGIVFDVLNQLFCFGACRIFAHFSEAGFNSWCYVTSHHVEYINRFLNHSTHILFIHRQECLCHWKLGWIDIGFHWQFKTATKENLSAKWHVFLSNAFL